MFGKLKEKIKGWAKKVSEDKEKKEELEARGTDLSLTRGDLAFRANFGTIDSLKKGNVIDRRAGRTLTTSEAQLLAKAINKIKMPCEFVFEPTVQHRAALVFRGGFSDNITGNDLTYVRGKNKSVTKIGSCKPMDDDENSQYSANIVNDFVEKVFEVLNEHPVNKEREKKGLLPANYLFVRGAGIETPKLKQYKKWVSASYMPMEIGFSKTCGMKTFSFEYPSLKELDVYKNLYEGLRKACKHSIKVIKKNHKTSDYAYIHIKETDLPGHDNKPFEKKAMIEYIDKTLFRFLKRYAPPNNVNVLVTADHSTPCRLKTHSADPVPVLLYNDSIPKPNFIDLITSRKETEKKGKKFCEEEAKRGSLGKIFGKELLKKVGFVK